MLSQSVVELKLLLLFRRVISERERETERDKQRETERETETERDKQRETERETETERQRDRDTERQRYRETERDRERQRKTERDRARGIRKEYRQTDTQVEVILWWSERDTEASGNL